MWIVRFDGYASVQFSSGPVLSPSRATKQYLLDAPDGLSQHVDPTTGKFDIGLVTFRLIDKNSEITLLFATQKASPQIPTIQNRKVTILLGYADLLESDYASVPGGVVNEASFVAAVWTVKLGDAKRETIEELFTNADSMPDDKVSTTLTQAAAAGSLLLKLANQASVTQDMKLMVGPNGSGQEERVEVFSIGSGNVTIKEALQFSYSTGHSVRWATSRVKGNPVNILYSILTGTFSTSGSFPLLSFDGLPTGLGMAAADIDTTGMIAERDDWLSNIVMSFEIRKPERAKTFLEREFLKLFGLLVIKPDGKLGFRAHRPRLPTESVLKISDGDVIGAARVRRRLDLAVNRIVVRYDYDAQNDRFITERTFEDTAVQAEVGVRELMVELKGGLSTDAGGLASDVYIEAFAKRYLARFLHGPTEIEIDTHFTKRVAELGEDCDLDLEDIPNPRTGTRGITHSEIVPAKPGPSYQVTEIRENPEGFTIVLLEGGYVRPMFIASAGQPDYGSATEAQRRRWYISPISGGNFTSDGTQPYQVI